MSSLQKCQSMFAHTLKAFVAFFVLEVLSNAEVNEEYGIPGSALLSEDAFVRSRVVYPYADDPSTRTIQGYSTGGYPYEGTGRPTDFDEGCTFAKIKAKWQLEQGNNNFAIGTAVDKSLDNLLFPHWKKTHAMYLNAETSTCFLHPAYKDPLQPNACSANPECSELFRYIAQAMRLEYEDMPTDCCPGPLLQFPEFMRHHRTLNDNMNYTLYMKNSTDIADNIDDITMLAYHRCCHRNAELADNVLEPPGWVFLSIGSPISLYFLSPCIMLYNTYLIRSWILDGTYPERRGMGRGSYLRAQYVEYDFAFPFLGWIMFVFSGIPPTLGLCQLLWLLALFYTVLAWIYAERLFDETKTVEERASLKTNRILERILKIPEGWSAVYAAKLCALNEQLDVAHMMYKAHVDNEGLDKPYEIDVAAALARPQNSARLLRELEAMETRKAAEEEEPKTKMELCTTCMEYWCNPKNCAYEFKKNVTQRSINFFFNQIVRPIGNVLRAFGLDTLPFVPKGPVTDDFQWGWGIGFLWILIVVLPSAYILDPIIGERSRIVAALGVPTFIALPLMYVVHCVSVHFNPLYEEMGQIVELGSIETGGKKKPWRGWRESGFSTGLDRATFLTDYLWRFTARYVRAVLGGFLLFYGGYTGVVFVIGYFFYKILMFFIRVGCWLVFVLIDWCCRIYEGEASSSAANSGVQLKQEQARSCSLGQWVAQYPKKNISQWLRQGATKEFGPKCLHTLNEKWLFLCTDVLPELRRLSAMGATMGANSPMKSTQSNTRQRRLSGLPSSVALAENTSDAGRAGFSRISISRNLTRQESTIRDAELDYQSSIGVHRSLPGKNSMREITRLAKLLGEDLTFLLDLRDENMRDGRRIRTSRGVELDELSLAELAIECEGRLLPPRYKFLEEIDAAAAAVHGHHHQVSHKRRHGVESEVYFSFKKFKSHIADLRAAIADCIIPKDVETFLDHLNAVCVIKFDVQRGELTWNNDAKKEQDYFENLVGWLRGIKQISEKSEKLIDEMWFRIFKTARKQLDKSGEVEPDLADCPNPYRYNTQKLAALITHGEKIVKGFEEMRSQRVLMMLRFVAAVRLLPDSMRETVDEENYLLNDMNFDNVVQRDKRGHISAIRKDWGSIAELQKAKRIRSNCLWLAEVNEKVLEGDGLSALVSQLSRVVFQTSAAIQMFIDESLRPVSLPTADRDGNFKPEDFSQYIGTRLAHGGRMLPEFHNLTLPPAASGESFEQWSKRMCEVAPEFEPRWRGWKLLGKISEDFPSQRLQEIGKIDLKRALNNIWDSTYVLLPTLQRQVKEGGLASKVLMPCCDWKRLNMDVEIPRMYGQAGACPPMFVQRNMIPPEPPVSGTTYELLNKTPKASSYQSAVADASGGQDPLKLEEEFEERVGRRDANPPVDANYLATIGVSLPHSDYMITDIYRNKNVKTLIKWRNPMVLDNFIGDFSIQCFYYVNHPYYLVYKVLALIWKILYHGFIEVVGIVIDLVIIGWTLMQLRKVAPGFTATYGFPAVEGEVFDNLETKDSLLADLFPTTVKEKLQDMKPIHNVQTAFSYLFDPDFDFSMAGLLLPKVSCNPILNFYVSILFKMAFLIFMKSISGDILGVLSSAKTKLNLTLLKEMTRKREKRRRSRFDRWHAQKSRSDAKKRGMPLVTDDGEAVVPEQREESLELLFWLGKYLVPAVSDRIEKGTYLVMQIYALIFGSFVAYGLQEMQGNARFSDVGKCDVGSTFVQLSLDQDHQEPDMVSRYVNYLKDYARANGTMYPARDVNGNPQPSNPIPKENLIRNEVQVLIIVQLLCFLAGTYMTSCGIVFAIASHLKSTEVLLRRVFKPRTARAQALFGHLTELDIDRNPSELIVNLPSEGGVYQTQDEKALDEEKTPEASSSDEDQLSEDEDGHRASVDNMSFGFTDKARVQRGVAATEEAILKMRQIGLAEKRVEVDAIRALVRQQRQKEKQAKKDGRKARARDLADARKAREQAYVNPFFGDGIHFMDAASSNSTDVTSSKNTERTERSKETVKEQSNDDDNVEDQKAEEEISGETLLPSKQHSKLSSDYNEIEAGIEYESSLSSCILLGGADEHAEAIDMNEIAVSGLNNEDSMTEIDSDEEQAMLADYWPESMPQEDDEGYPDMKRQFSTKKDVSNEKAASNKKDTPAKKDDPETYSSSSMEEWPSLSKEEVHGADEVSHPSLSNEDASSKQASSGSSSSSFSSSESGGSSSDDKNRSSDSEKGNNSSENESNCPTLKEEVASLGGMDCDIKSDREGEHKRALNDDLLLRELEGLTLVGKHEDVLLDNHDPFDVYYGRDVHNIMPGCDLRRGAPVALIDEKRGVLHVTPRWEKYGGREIPDDRIKNTPNMCKKKFYKPLFIDTNHEGKRARVSIRMKVLSFGARRMREGPLKAMIFAENVIGVNSSNADPIGTMKMAVKFSRPMGNRPRIGDKVCFMPFKRRPRAVIQHEFVRQGPAVLPGPPHKELDTKSENSSELISKGQQDATGMTRKAKKAHLRDHMLAGGVEDPTDGQAELRPRDPKRYLMLPNLNPKEANEVWTIDFFSGTISPHVNDDLVLGVADDDADDKDASTLDIILVSKLDIKRRLVFPSLLELQKSYRAHLGTSRTLRRKNCRPGINKCWLQLLGDYLPAERDDDLGDVNRPAVEFLCDSLAASDRPCPVIKAVLEGNERLIKAIIVERGNTNSIQGTYREMIPLSRFLQVKREEGRKSDSNEKKMTWDKAAHANYYSLDAVQIAALCGKLKCLVQLLVLGGQSPFSYGHAPVWARPMVLAENARAEHTLAFLAEYADRCGMEDLMQDEYLGLSAERMREVNRMKPWLDRIRQMLENREFSSLAEIKENADPEYAEEVKSLKNVPHLADADIRGGPILSSISCQGVAVIHLMFAMWGNWLKQCFAVEPRIAAYSRVLAFEMDIPDKNSIQYQNFAQDLQGSTARAISLMFLALPGGGIIAKWMEYLHTPGLDHDHRIRTWNGEEWVEQKSWPYFWKYRTRRWLGIFNLMSLFAVFGMLWFPKFGEELFLFAIFLAVIRVLIVELRLCAKADAGDYIHRESCIWQSLPEKGGWYFAPAPVDIRPLSEALKDRMDVRKRGIAARQSDPTGPGSVDMIPQG